MTSKLSGLRHQNDGGVLNRSSKTSRAVEDADGSDLERVEVEVKGSSSEGIQGAGLGGAESDPGAGLCLLASRL